MATPNLTIVWFSGPTDGTTTTHPQNGRNGYYQVDDARLRKVLAKLWETEYHKVQSTPVPQPGPYIVSKLPYGFAVFEKQRMTPSQGTTNQVFGKDRYIFGHFGGGKYRSAREFFPHLMYLATYNQTRARCTFNGGTAQTPPTTAAIGYDEQESEEENGEGGAVENLGLDNEDM
ncbi:MAG: hypothetical protein Q9187_001564 [Circinaria calcarea]